MPAWVGTGVATPLPALAVVAGSGVGAGDGHACVGVGPQPAAREARCRVPGEELGETDSAALDDGIAAVPRLNEVECIAVIDYVRLRRDS